MDELCLVEAVDRLGESVVIAVADAADEGLDTSLGEALAISNADVLRTPVGMMHEVATMDRPSPMQGLLQRVEHEAGMGRPAHPPADDPLSIGIDHEGDIDEA